MSHDVRVPVVTRTIFFFDNRICRCGGMADALASGASVRKDVGVQNYPHLHQNKRYSRKYLLFLSAGVDGIGRRSGLKIHRWRQRTGSSPVTGLYSVQAVQSKF